MMEKENTLSLDKPSQNDILNPLKNKYLDMKENVALNPLKNPKINPKLNPKSWRENQFETLKETPIWEYMTRKQKLQCMIYLKNSKD